MLKSTLPPVVTVVANMSYGFWILHGSLHTNYGGQPKHVKASCGPSHKQFAKTANLCFSSFHQVRGIV